MIFQYNSLHQKHYALHIPPTIINHHHFGAEIVGVGNNWKNPAGRLRGNIKNGQMWTSAAHVKHYPLHILRTIINHHRFGAEIVGREDIKERDVGFLASSLALIRSERRPTAFRTYGAATLFQSHFRLKAISLYYFNFHSLTAILNGFVLSPRKAQKRLFLPLFILVFRPAIPATAEIHFLVVCL